MVGLFEQMAQASRDVARGNTYRVTLTTATGTEQIDVQAVNSCDAISLVLKDRNPIGKARVTARRKK